MRSRIAVGVALAAISVFAVGAIARACESVSGSVSPSSAGPGDPIGYSISGLDPGATYRATIEGQQTDSGVSSGSAGTVGGSFPMPDYGDQPRTVYVTLYAAHSEDNFEWDRPFAVQYTPPAATQPANSPAPTQASVPARKTSAPRVHVHRHGPPQPIAIAKHAAQRQKHDGGTNVGAGTGAAPADAVGSEPGPTHPSSGSGEAKGAGEKSSSVPHKVLDVVGSTTKVGPADVPTIGLLLIGVIVIAGAALAAFVIYLLRRGPDPEAAIKAPAPIDPDPVEAELQEMIADEMARQLLSDLDLGQRMLTRR